jgi:Zn-finger nucleic acid-binding protein
METSALSCPVCRVNLLLAPVDTGELPVCGYCGGTWLDNARSQRVVKGLISDNERALAAHASVGAVPLPGATYRTAPPREQGDAPRPCADCGKPMARTQVQEIGIELDACPAHGTWFDARELVAIAEMFALKSAADDADCAAFKKELSAAKRGEAIAHADFGAHTLGRLLR